MDREYVKFLLTDPVEDNDRKIQLDERIDAELIELFRSNPKNISRCFAKHDVLSMDAKYEVECICARCHQMFVKRLSKTATIEYVKKPERIQCPECTTHQKKLQADILAERESVYKQRQEENTQVFIENYLNPECSWKSGIKFQDMRSSIEGVPLYTEAIADHIKQMKYSDFLQTPYWKYVSLKARHKAGYKCALCGNTGMLNVHHKSYEHHGYENTYEGLNDLIVLCQPCHAKFHDKVVD